MKLTKDMLTEMVKEVIQEQVYTSKFASPPPDQYEQNLIDLRTVLENAARHAGDLEQSFSEAENEDKEVWKANQSRRIIQLKSMVKAINKLAKELL